MAQRLGGMQVSVRTLLGTTSTLDVEAGDSIENVKAKIYNKEGIIPALQRLFFEGIELADDRALEDYNILPGATLDMLPPLPKPPLVVVAAAAARRAAAAALRAAAASAMAAVAHAGRLHASAFATALAAEGEDEEAAHATSAVTEAASAAALAAERAASAARDAEMEAETVRAAALGRDAAAT